MSSLCPALLVPGAGPKHLSPCLEHSPSPLGLPSGLAVHPEGPVLNLLLLSLQSRPPCMCYSNRFSAHVFISMSLSPSRPSMPCHHKSHHLTPVSGPGRLLAERGRPDQSRMDAQVPRARLLTRTKSLNANRTHATASPPEDLSNPSSHVKATALVWAPPRHP